MKLKPTGLILIILLALYGLFLFHKIDLTSADLGRHIRNGEQVFDNLRVLNTNFYAYTFPDFPTINHHWGAGVIFYLFWKIGGIAGTQVLYILLSLGALVFFYLAAAKRAGPHWAGLVALAALPVILARSEIRPEAWSYFFAGLFYYLLSEFRENSRTKWLWLLPGVQILWVNFHIYFFVGPVLLLFFLLESARQNGWSAGSTKRLAILFMLIGLASLANPFGLPGALAPFNIFNAYGYRVLENSPVWVLENIIPSPIYPIFKILGLVLLLSFLLVMFKDRKKTRLPEALLAVMLSVMAWTALRNFAIFAFFAIPLLAGNLKFLLNWPRKFTYLIPAIGILTILLTLSGELRLLSYSPNFGLGALPGNSAAVDFFKSSKLQSPIFNNYDIGGYLIYHLFPHPSSLSPGGRGQGEGERVFVDNRPEAYPPEFFQKEYIPMQQDETVWQKQLKRYHFQTIFFSHTDLTPWAQTFLAARASDPQWKQVFFDSRIVIFQKVQ